MRKIILPLFAIITLVFHSCQVEPVEDDNMDSVSLITNKHCTVNLLPNLPSLVDVCITQKNPDTDNGYLDLTISNTSIAGNYSAWCVDVDLVDLEPGECFPVNVYSSYAELPAGKFENPQNFELVNWILNQNFVGKASPSGGNYTFGDIQWAIWELIDDRNCILCAHLGDDWSTTKGQELVELALTNGRGYKPAAGNVMAVVLLPTANKQSVIIPMTLQCEPEPVCDTAFARGNDGNSCFIDNGFNRWGWSIGPLTEGTQETYEIYAGAGQCDTDKGELAGTVDVSYIAGKVTVTYNIDDAYDVKETHSYAGNAMFPVDKKGKPTVAPGQYTIGKNLTGEIYVIAHAVVCK